MPLLRLRRAQDVPLLRPTLAPRPAPHQPRRPQPRHICHHHRRRSRAVAAQRSRGERRGRRPRRLRHEHVQIRRQRARGPARGPRDVLLDLAGAAPRRPRPAGRRHRRAGLRVRHQSPVRRTAGPGIPRRGRDAPAARHQEPAERRGHCQEHEPAGRGPARAHGRLLDTRGPHHARGHGRPRRHRGRQRRPRQPHQHPGHLAGRRDLRSQHVAAAQPACARAYRRRMRVFYLVCVLVGDVFIFSAMCNDSSGYVLGQRRSAFYYARYPPPSTEIHFSREMVPDRPVRILHVCL